MRGLSLTQPWAQLVAIGAKRIETRSWSTKYRGAIAIHAARRAGHAEISAAQHPAFVDKLRAAGYVLEGPVICREWNVPRGVVVAVAQLVDVVRVEDLEAKPIDVYEGAFGNYESGRWAFMLDAVRPLKRPLPVRGMQGLWPLPDQLACRLARQVEERAR